jgi:hypothetical protein
VADVLGRRIRGNFVYTDTHAARVVEAFGPDVIRYFEDFVCPQVASDALAGWITTLVEAGAGESTVTVPDIVGGALLLTTDAAENDGISLQMDGESFQVATGRDLYFGIRFQISDATQSDFFVGLAITDTTPLGGVTDGIYFQKDDGAATFKATTEKDSTETNSAAIGTITAATNVILEIWMSGLTAYFYVNGTRVATHTTNLPDDEALTPTIQFLTGEAVAKTMQIDWIRVVQFGR